MTDYPAQWQPPVNPAVDTRPVPPRELRPVLVLLVTNLVLSVALTVATLIARHSIVDFQLDHRNITDPEQRRIVGDSVRAGLFGRVFGNVVVSVVYVFLVRALLRGRRWAYRRVIWIGAVGIVGLLLTLVQPYPLWMHVEQVVQALVLGALLWFVLRPEVRAHFASGLPGRDVRRFNRGPRG